MVDVDVSTIFAEQITDPVPATIRSGLGEVMSPDTRPSEIQKSKGFLRIFQEFNYLVIEGGGQL